MSNKRTFIKYVVVGAIIGLAATAILAISERVFSSSPLSYLTSVALIYISGTALSYILQKRITFLESTEKNHTKAFSKFVAVASFGAITATYASYLLKYHVPWPLEYISFAGPVSFVIACVATSMATFFLNKTWVFRVKITQEESPRKSQCD